MSRGLQKASLYKIRVRIIEFFHDPKLVLLIISPCPRSAHLRSLLHCANGSSSSSPPVHVRLISVLCFTAPTVSRRLSVHEGKGGGVGGVVATATSAGTVAMRVECPGGGQCMRRGGYCDFNQDCSDGSDEGEEECSELYKQGYCQRQGMVSVACGMIECPSDPTYCISETDLCDGEEHCLGGWDEANCLPHPCPPGWLKCPKTGYCTPAGNLCDGVTDCFATPEPEDEDPDLCRAYACPEGWRKCADGEQCVQQGRWCDGLVDCAAEGLGICATNSRLQQDYERRRGEMEQLQQQLKEVAAHNESLRREISSNDARARETEAQLRAQMQAERSELERGAAVASARAASDLRAALSARDEAFSRERAGLAQQLADLRRELQAEREKEHPCFTCAERAWRDEEEAEEEAERRRRSEAEVARWQQAAGLAAAGLVIESAAKEFLLDRVDDLERSEVEMEQERLESERAEREEGRREGEARARAEAESQRQRILAQWAEERDAWERRTAEKDQEVARLVAEKAEVEIKLRGAEAEVERLKAEAAAQQRVVENLTRDRHMLARKSEDLSARAAAAQRRADLAEEAAEVAEAQAEDERDLAASLQRELQMLKAKFLHQEAEKEKLEMDVAEARDQLSVVEEQDAIVRKNLRKAEEELDVLVDECAEMRRILRLTVQAFEYHKDSILHLPGMKNLSAELVTAAAEFEDEERTDGDDSVAGGS
ncbi:unnamed protein product [Closterium sp. NIES-64]|nr:unnamed protein product [Closterium sp. NIES-64]